jgi:Asp-tRNA(Asn)/Glu-tRNA(Gln) amidotransferase B subunit
MTQPHDLLDPEQTPEQLEAMCRQILEENKELVAARDQTGQIIMGFLLGKVMTQTHGAANPREVAAVFRRLLA